MVAATLCAMILAAATFLQAASPAPGSLITNVASVKYSDASNYPQPAVSGSCVTEVGGSPVLRASKRPSSDPVAAGGRLTYTIEYENSGNIAAEGVTLVDILSPLVTPVVYEPAEYVPAAGGEPAKLIWKIASLPAGTRGSFQFGVDVGSPPQVNNNDKIINKLDFSSASTGSQSILITTVGQAPNLQVEINVSRPAAAPGDEIEYTVSYRNIGNLPSTNSVLSVQLPNQTALVEGSISNAGGVSGRIVRWNLDSLSPGSSGHVTFRIRVSPVAQTGVSIVAMAVIVCDELGAVSSNDAVTLVRQTPGLAVTKIAGSPAVRVGDLLSYTIEVRNTGNVALSRIILRDRIPEGTSPVVKDGAGQLVEGYCIWQFSSLAPEETQRVTLDLLIGSYSAILGSVDNLAEAFCSETEMVSASTRTTVVASNRSIIEFIDAKGRPTTMFGPEDPIGIRVTDLSENGNPRLIDSIFITLINSTSGDSEKILLSETGVNTGVFEGQTTQTRSQPARSDDGFLTTDEDNALTASYADPEFPGTAAIVDLAWINPVGVVFDSITGLPVAGAQVTLIDNGTGAPANLPDISLRGATGTTGRSSTRQTGSDGKFSFGPIPPGNYHLLVACAGYTFPSAEATGNLAAQYSILSGSRGEDFTIGLEATPLTFDVPLDREAKDLLIEKTSAKTRVSAGEMIPWKLVLTNRSPGPLTEVKITDTLPHGIQYVPGSTRIDGKSYSDPDNQGNRTLNWQIPAMISGKKVEVSYVTVAGPGVKPGKIANSAFAAALHLGRSIRSRTVAAEIDVREGLFTDRGTIIGTVFIDYDDDGRKRTAAEVGMAGIRLILEDGSVVETDAEGLFSLPGVRPGTHLLRIDTGTLPPGTVPRSIAARDSDSPQTRIIELPHGGLYIADFPLLPEAGFVLPSIASSVAELPGSASASHRTEPPDWEKLIASLTPDLEILSPTDGFQNPGSLLKLVVKGPIDKVLQVSINGQNAEGLKPARTVTQRIAGIKIQEFIGLPLLEAATSTIKVTSCDVSGNKAAEASLSVYAAGGAHELRVTPPAAGITADGKTIGKVQIEIADRFGRLVGIPLTVTLEIDKGEIVSPDADPSMEGHQILLENGTAEVALRGPFEACSGRLVAHSGKLAGTAVLQFVPKLSARMLIGLGEVVIGKGNSSGDTSFMRRWEGFSEGTYHGGRSAFFYNGRLGSDMQLTAAYDSAKERDSELFRMSEADPNLEYRYPIMGDAGKVFYSAMSQKKFYLKLEKGMSRLLYGDLNTELDQTRTGAYTRMLNGLQLRIAGSRAGLNSFYTRTDRTLVVDILQAQGISGFYSLTSRRIVPGSERLVIETRERWRPEFVIDRQPKTRDLDYEIDYTMGTIRMKNPISSSDAALNPIYLIVSYEHESENEKYPVAGGRAFYKPGKNIEIGATSVKEEQMAGDYSLNALDLTLKLPGNSTMQAEWARSDSLFDEAGGYRQRNDSAHSVELKGNPGERLKYEAWYRRAGDYFKNPSAVDVFSGSHRMGGKFRYQLQKGLALRGMHYLENDDRNDMFYRHSSAGIEKTMTRTTFGVDYIEERAQDGYLPATLQGNRQPFDIAEQTPDRLKAGQLSVEHSLNERLTLQLSHKRNLSGRPYRFSNAGLQYQLNSLTHLYVREEIARFDALKDTRLVAGAESEVVRNTVAFSEYRLGHGSSENRIQQSMGLRNTFMLGRSATGNLTMERLETTSGNELSQQPDATAVSLGVECLPLEDLKFSTRIERRLSGSGDTDSLDVSLAWSASRDLHLSLSERWYKLEQPDSDLTNASRLLLGIAYRPLFWHRFSALGKVERRKGMTSGMQIGGDNSRVMLYSFDGVYQVTPQWQVIGRIAAKQNEELGFSEKTRLISGRVVCDLSRRFDLSTEYRVMTGETAESTLRGANIEIGTALCRDLWLGLGYSFEKFDADLIGDQYEGKGIYLRARFKFDEDLFADRRRRNKKPVPARH